MSLAGKLKELDAFTLFCWYYLGLTPVGDFQFVNANKIAKRLNCTVDDLMKQLAKHDMHPDRVLNTNFPMPRYQVDLQMAAEKEDADQLLARAQGIYEVFQGSMGNKRDWLKEIEEEQEADRRIKHR